MLKELFSKPLEEREKSLLYKSLNPQAPLGKTLIKVSTLKKKFDKKKDTETKKKAELEEAKKKKEKRNIKKSTKTLLPENSFYEELSKDPEIRKFLTMTRKKS